MVHHVMLQRFCYLEATEVNENMLVYEAAGFKETMCFSDFAQML